MPATYAHHRFGRIALPNLPEDVRRKIQHFRQLYDVGQQGPDLFFYFQPLFHTKTGSLGHKFHDMSGKEFFETAAARLREAPSEGAEAYLFGVLGHYILDSACHPFVRQRDAEGTVGHTELETEFDRHLLELDGIQMPHLQNLGKHIRLTWGECVTVSGFYPPASAYAIRRSVLSMAAVNRVLAIRNRKLLETAFRLGGQSASQMVMYTRPNHKCAELLQPLCTRFEEAAARYPGLAVQLSACLRSGEALGPDFEPNFG